MRANRKALILTGFGFVSLAATNAAPGIGLSGLMAGILATLVGFRWGVASVLYFYGVASVFNPSALSALVTMGTLFPGGLPLYLALSWVGRAFSTTAIGWVQWRRILPRRLGPLLRRYRF